MKKIIIIITVILAMSITVNAQNYSIAKENFKKTIKQIGDSLPNG